MSLRMTEGNVAISKWKMYFFYEIAALRSQ